MVNTSVSLANITLRNPVVPASGTFGFGREFADWYDLNDLGGICLKGTTKNPRFGNETPRIAEAPAGLLNAVGLQNPGIAAVLNQEVPALRQVFSGPIFANISGFSTEEYVFCCEKASHCPEIAAIELNISCPNVESGGYAFGALPKTAAAITKAVRAVCQKPLFVKLSPNVFDIAEIAKACESEGADGISLINTVLAMRIDLAKRKPVLANTTGGLSGPAVLPIALRMVWQVFSAVSVPILGMGGVSSAEDVVEMMLAGATCVQVGAANLQNPFACQEIIQNLPAVMDRYKIKSLSSIIGGAHPC